MESFPYHLIINSFQNFPEVVKKCFLMSNNSPYLKRGEFSCEGDRHDLELGS